MIGLWFKWENHSETQFEKDLTLENGEFVEKKFHKTENQKIPDFTHVHNRSDEFLFPANVDPLNRVKAEFEE